VLLGLWFALRLIRAPRDEVRAQVRGDALAIMIIGGLIATSYLRVLIALRDGMSTQVLAVRQLSIPIGCCWAGTCCANADAATPSVFVDQTGCVLAALL
jgi:hypothetical protein